MGRSVVNLDGLYVEWCSVVDMPVAYYDSLDDVREDSFKDYLKETLRGDDTEEFRIQAENLARLKTEQRMKRLEKKGTTHWVYPSAQDQVRCNGMDLSWEDFLVFARKEYEDLCGEGDDVSDTPVEDD